MKGIARVHHAPAARNKGCYDPSVPVLFIVFTLMMLVTTDVYGKMIFQNINRSLLLWDRLINSMFFLCFFGLMYFLVFWQ
jgi:hypothetical protein